jgi:hypothetical protein
VLAGLAAGVAGCVGGTESGFDGFADAVRDRVEVQALSRERDAWVLEYHVDEGPAPDARRLAPPYAEHVPSPPHGALAVTSLTLDNRVVAEYRIPAGMARRRHEGRLDAETYRDRVADRAREGTR